MKFILGTKLNMSQRFRDGVVVPVTEVSVKSCAITQVKTAKTDGYNAVQIGAGVKRKLIKPISGHLKDLTPFRHLREFRVSDVNSYARGTILDVNSFSVGEKVTVRGTSKGRGFQGVVKRHGFAGHPTTHGHKDQERMPGSIGAGGNQRVLKGTLMAGRMGNAQVTVKNLEVIEIDAEKNLIALKGAVPGARGSLLLIESATGDQWK